MENELLKQENVSEEAKVDERVDEGRKFKMPSRKVIYIIIAVAAIAGILFYFKGLLVAATVNGSFISRVSVVKELEKQSGQAALDSLIVTKLIENEVKDIKLSKEELDEAVGVVSEQIKAQGTTLEDLLMSRGMTEEEFRKNLTLQKKLEKLMADKTMVTDEEVAQYAKDNKASLPTGMDANALKAQISETIKQNKFSTEVGQLIDALKAEANIKLFVNY